MNKPPDPFVSQAPQTAEPLPAGATSVENPAISHDPTPKQDGGDTDRLSRLDAAGVRRMNRRELLKLAPLVVMGAFALPSVSERLVRRGLATSDWAAEKFHRSQRMVPVYDDKQVTPFERFPYNTYGAHDPGVDLDNWTLTVEGLVERPGEYTLEQIMALPKQVQNVRHICIEGWDVIGNFGGARLADFLRLVGADPQARFVEVTCLDDYYSSYDMASCLHPQTLLCYEMYGRPLDRGHGAPLRIHMPTKLGYKSSKYLSTMRISNVLGRERGFWEDQGYSWFGGI
jgi:DMSO/TMAO reductase YedYZ molybdopterin-dependent catalytic subunit